MDARFDIDAIRREFPVTGRMLYFDVAHQAPLARSIKQALERFYDEGLETAGPKSKWIREPHPAAGCASRLTLLTRATGPY